MNIATTHADRTRYRFSHAEFDAIAELVHERFGLHTPREKKQLVYSRLVKRLRALSIGSFRDYCAFVRGDDGMAELGKLLSALTTNTSHFFREQHHFDLLETEILPGLIERARAGGRVRLWSAGCAAGQEPYSIAFSILKLCPEARKLDIKILATDVDDVVLEQARRGQYETAEVGKIAQTHQDFLVIEGEEVTIRPAAKELISFTHLNLIAHWPTTAAFDVIFCRNVAIYFDKPTQAQLWARFSERLAADSTLFIGHSERLSADITPQYRQIGITAFAKIAAVSQTHKGEL